MILSLFVMTTILLISLYTIMIRQIKKICHVLKIGIVSVIKENNNFLIESFNSKQFQSLFLEVFVSPVYYCSTLLLWMPNVHKMVKQTMKIVEQILQYL